MKWLKKKEKAKKANTEEVGMADENTSTEFKKNTINKAMYEIQVYECISSLPRRVMKFKAQRIVDEEDHIPYLKYENAKTKKVWLEIFPQQSKDFMNYTQHEVEKKIKEVRAKIREEQEKKFSNVNIKDLEYDLIKLEAKARSFKFSNNSSYVSLDENNVPVIFYKREGSSFIPFKWDVDSSTIYLPSDNKKKSSAVALRNKENKYPTRENQVRIATMVVFVVAFLLAAGAGFWHYKAFQAYDTNEINKIKESNLEDINKLNQIFQKQANTMNTFLNNMSQNVIVVGNDNNKNRPVNFDKEK